MRSMTSQGRPCARFRHALATGNARLERVLERHTVELPRRLQREERVSGLERDPRIIDVT